MTRLTSGALVVAVAVGGSLVTGGVAAAAPPAGSLGNLTITPPTGSDIDVPTARTSGPCPATAQGANVLITGPVGIADPTFPPDNPYPIVTFTDVSFSTTDPFDLSFELSLKDAAVDRGKPLQVGEYNLTAQCVKRLGGVEGTFTGALFFTSPTAYQTTDPNVNPTATTTVLAVTPASPAAAGTQETLTATVSPVGAVGSVQFKDGTNNVGGVVAVSSGSASAKTTLPVGTHSLTAVFTPTDPTKFGSSTSNPVSYEVKVAQPTATTTVLAVTPASPAAAGTQETLTATVSPVGAVGSVQFKDGTNNVGGVVAVSSGSASAKTTLPVGTHSLTAVFTPTDPTKFGSSTSNPVSYEVNAPTGAKVTTTTLTVAPRPAFQGLPVFLRANVAPVGATGTVQFKDGTIALGAPVPVFSGTAFLLTSKLTKGTHSLTAVFTPANPAAFGPSTSSPVSLTVRSIFDLL